MGRKKFLEKRPHRHARKEAPIRGQKTEPSETLLPIRGVKGEERHAEGGRGVLSAVEDSCEGGPGETFCRDLHRNLRAKGVKRKHRPKRRRVSLGEVDLGGIRRNN